VRFYHERTNDELAQFEAIVCEVFYIHHDAGESVGAVKCVLAARAVVRELVEEAEQLLRH